jgi:hypothetical protein
MRLKFRRASDLCRPTVYKQLDAGNELLSSEARKTAVWRGFLFSVCLFTGGSEGIGRATEIGFDGRHAADLLCDVFPAPAFVTFDVENFLNQLFAAHGSSPSMLEAGSK